MPLENPYCTVDQVRKELKNSTPGIDEQIEDAINAVSRFIDDHRGRDYFQHDHTSTPVLVDKYDSAALVREVLFLASLKPTLSPIITLTSVTVAGELWILNTDYMVKDSRLICLDGNWSDYIPNATDKISILGKFGYAQSLSSDVPTGLPAHINKAAIQGAATLSGHNRKEWIDALGTKQSKIESSFPKTFWDLLGKRAGVV